MQAGATDYLTKPCNPDELLLKVDKLLETKRLREEVIQLRREVAPIKIWRAHRSESGHAATLWRDWRSKHEQKHRAHYW
jgi:DNA-binding response OmpR family regulator